MKHKKHNYSSGGPSLFSFNSIQGILFTISNYVEKEARREAVALLEQYAEIDYDTFLPPEDEKETDSSTKVDSFVDICKEIEKEISSLKKNQQTGFQVLDAHSKGYIFVRFLNRDENPVSLCQRIMKHFLENPSENLQTRYLNRMIPVQNMCHGTLENFKTMAQPLLQSFFSKFETKSLKYKVIIKKCNSNTLENQDVITTICNSIPLRHFASMKEFHVAILVTMMKNVCMMSIVENYNELLELNINAIKNNKQDVPPKQEEEKETLEIPKKRRKLLSYKIHNQHDFDGIYLI